MNLTEYKNIVLDTIIKPMMSFMEDCDDCDYSEEDVLQCKNLIFTYLEALAEMIAPSDDTIMEQVKILVLALNDLDEQTDYSLIETSEREAIWEIIQTSAIACGLTDYSDDITEEWREW